MSRPWRLLAAPDKFKGTASATEVAAAIARAADAAGWTCEQIPISDGGDGLLDCFGGANRFTDVRGPLDSPVRAGWRLDDRRAVIEMATASGLALVTGQNDPVASTTTGTGQLIAAAIEAGATDIVVGAGGSASTDGGSGAVDVLERYAPLDGSHGHRVVVAVDVRAGFLDAAATFAPQKGADAGQVALLTARLRQQAADYLHRFGIDVTSLDGGGAAGGLAGGLAALGAGIRPGFALVAVELDLARKIGEADLVVTGEGRLDRTSLMGKGPNEVVRMGERLATPVALVVGEVAADVEPPPHTVALLDRFGRDAAFAQPLACIQTCVTDLLAEASQWIT